MSSLVCCFVLLFLFIVFLLQCRGLNPCLLCCTQALYTELNPQTYYFPFGRQRLSQNLELTILVRLGSSARPWNFIVPTCSTWSTGITSVLLCPTSARFCGSKVRFAGIYSKYITYWAIAPLLVLTFKCNMGKTHKDIRDRILYGRWPHCVPTSQHNRCLKCSMSFFSRLRQIFTTDRTKFSGTWRQCF